MTNYLHSGEYINFGELEVPVDTSKLEAKYNAKYIGEFCLKTTDGSWANAPAQLYWQETPPVKGYSNYFAVFTRGESVYITSGQSIADAKIFAIRSGDEIIFSKYRWDNRSSKDGRVSIDGGRDYVKISGSPDEHLTLGFDGPNLVVVQREMYLCEGN